MSYSLFLKWKFTKEQVTFLGNGETITSEIKSVEELPGASFYIYIKKNEKASLYVKVDVPDDKYYCHECKMLYLNGKRLQSPTDFYSISKGNHLNKNFVYLLKDENELIIDVELKIKEIIQTTNTLELLWNDNNKDFIFTVEGKEIGVSIR